MQRQPVLAEITNLSMPEASEYLQGMEGVVAKPDGKVYAIIGWVYPEELVEAYW